MRIRSDLSFENGRIDVNVVSHGLLLGKALTNLFNWLCQGVVGLVVGAALGHGFAIILPGVYVWHACVVLKDRLEPRIRSGPFLFEALEVLLALLNVIVDSGVTGPFLQVGILHWAGLGGSTHVWQSNVALSTHAFLLGAESICVGIITPLI